MKGPLIKEILRIQVQCTLIHLYKLCTYVYVFTYVSIDEYKLSLIKQSSNRACADFKMNSTKVQNPRRNSSEELPSGEVLRTVLHRPCNIQLYTCISADAYEV